MFRGIRGVYLYAMNPNLRDFLSRHMDVAQRNTHDGNDGITLKISDNPGGNTIPYYDLEVAAGTFSELQQSEDTQFIEVAERYQNASRYFACKVVGESMNKVIPNGSVCLFEKYQGGTRHGLICLVESQGFEDRDFGANYTIKEYSSKKNVSEEGWQHEEIVLLPKSTDESYEPIVLRDEELLDFRVVGVLKRVLG